MHKAKAKGRKAAEAEIKKEQEKLQDSDRLQEQEVSINNEAATDEEQSPEVFEGVSELESEIEALKEDLLEANDCRLRLAAEYDNFRKRSRQEKDDLYNKSIVDVCTLWLPLMDNLDRAIIAMQGIEQEESKQAAEGVALVLRQAVEILEKLGVKEIPALGESFDPNLHEAVMHVEDEEKGSGEIVEVFLKGYAIGDKVLRHSVVKVAN